MNVSAKITLLAGLAPLPSFGGVQPSNSCVLVSKRHVFYELFEATLGLRENHVFYCPFEALRGLRKWREPAATTIFAETLVVFRSEREAEHCFFDLQRSYFQRKIQWFSYFISEVEDRFVKPVKYVPLGHQRALWGRFPHPKTL